MKLSPISEEHITIWMQRLDEFGVETGEPDDLNRAACLQAQIGDVLIQPDGKEWVVQERAWYFPAAAYGDGYIESTLTIYVRARP